MKNKADKAEEKAKARIEAKKSYNKRYGAESSSISVAVEIVDRINAIRDKLSKQYDLRNVSFPDMAQFIFSREPIGELKKFAHQVVTNTNPADVAGVKSKRITSKLESVQAIKMVSNAIKDVYLSQGLVFLHSEILCYNTFFNYVLSKFEQADWQQYGLFIDFCKKNRANYSHRKTNHFNISSLGLK